ncbi:c-type cytochrome [Nitratireductor luteus]|uniref:c-type cytochrome n=1 Tax=Nitratireductor luteus TaxID=2976980 RepID=UPI0022403F38|nr:c-type cytochrome [Nitratireductor luteus]
MAIGAVGATLFAASGIYNVAASVQHFQITERIIKFVLNRSVAVHSPDEVPTDIGDDRLAQLGARHFRLGCAPCHGMPGEDASPVMQQMYPAPPRLEHAALKWEAAELAWIIDNGLKFTGMPAWAGQGRMDEVWALVAFLRRLPNADKQEISELAGGPDGIPMLADQSTVAQSCISCHGNQEQPPVSPEVPSLSGQPRAYLQRALLEYRADLRQSGMMEPIAEALDDAAIERLASRFAAQSLPVAQNLELTRGEVDRGRTIATVGHPGGNVPPCLSCHGAGASELFPRLRGLSQEYIVGQLHLFQSGSRSQTAYGAIMSTVARRLTAEDMEDVAAFFAGQPEARTAGR